MNAIKDAWKNLTTAQPLQPGDASKVDLIELGEDLKRDPAKVYLTEPREVLHVGRGTIQDTPGRIAELRARLTLGTIL